MLWNYIAYFWFLLHIPFWQATHTHISTLPLSHKNSHWSGCGLWWAWQLHNICWHAISSSSNGSHSGSNCDLVRRIRLPAQKLPRPWQFSLSVEMQGGWKVWRRGQGGCESGRDRLTDWFIGLTLERTTRNSVLHNRATRHYHHTENRNGMNLAQYLKGKRFHWGQESLLDKLTLKQEVYSCKLLFRTKQLKLFCFYS